jgi:hypothetical protein
MEFETKILTTKWFLCIYASVLKNQIVNVIWDNMLLNGYFVLIKVGLILLDYCEV